MCLVSNWAGLTTGLQGNAKFISWFPHGLKNLGKHFPASEMSGNFEKTGKVTEFYPKCWKIEEILSEIQEK